MMTIPRRSNSVIAVQQHPHHHEVIDSKDNIRRQRVGSAAKSNYGTMTSGF
ncbi:hypothetical protein BIW11_03740 [Tropilaelaps mercedesae]|uniref:Uncharacterized protein n=1 Tax=Tropilaelaps mercedesae TaxID=418985 RepID=A0A1V9XGF8_9ACAR|nr:hypothetical protein BIW11_03740 [Tropilaelaps mercedesae]